MLEVIGVVAQVFVVVVRVFVVVIRVHPVVVAAPVIHLPSVAPLSRPPPSVLVPHHSNSTEH